VLTRELTGSQAVSADFQLESESGYQLFTESLEQSHAIALQSKPDLAAVRRSAVSARSQKALTKANEEQELIIGDPQQLRQADGVRR
jgi:hypothetical protein